MTLCAIQEDVVERSELLPEVLITGDFPFPTGSAASNNLHGHCRAIQAAGFSVGVLPFRVSKHADGEKGIIKRNYRGTPYWEIADRPARTKLHGFVREHLAKENPRLDWLDHNRLEGVKAVIAYTGVVGSAAFLFRLRRVCRTYGAKLYNFAVEWHEPRHLTGPGATLKRLDSELQRRLSNRSVDGVICISKSLHDYYVKRGQKSWLIPPLLDLSDPKWQNGGNHDEHIALRPLRLLFWGSCARDRHDLMLKAVLDLRRGGAPIVVEYLGSSREQIEQTPGVTSELLNSLGEGLLFHGRVPDEKVFAIIRSASFGILLRDDAKWSRRCFPSRIPEACALGLPVICNLTSDLSDYLVDGRNALLATDASLEGFRLALQRALALSGQELIQMRHATRLLAEQFDGARYADIYRDVLVCNEGLVEAGRGIGA